jgi:hypothetical protein
MDWVPQKCKHCPVFATAGKRTVNVEHDDPLWMDLLAGTMTTKARNNMYKDKLKVPATCPQVTISEDDVGVWPCEIRNGSNLAEDATPAVIVLEGNSPVLNQPADLEGSIVTSNRGSRAIFVAHSLTTRKRDLDAFVPDDFEIKKAHALIRSIKGEPHEKLDQMSEMFEKHVTGIFGQRLLHMAIDLVYHSIVQFKVGQFPVPRGWMELLAVGETRSGKSTAATRIKDVLGHGHLVGAENASIAGLLGGLEKSSGGIGGDGYVRRAGTLPLHNRKLIIFDEAQGLQIADISKMSDVRSRGEVQIAKIQHIEAQAQVRLIWLSNPRDGKRHARGIDALQDQMGAPEDLSRVDIPLFIKADVGDAFQKAKNDYGPLPFDTSILEWLVLWAWSRKPEQVVWSPEASDMIWAEANDLAVEYKTEIPIFQHNEAHIRLARLAVALAARLFSTTDGHTLQVNSGHVKSAVQLYSLFLGADSLGIRELKDASDWRKEQGMLSQDELRMIIRGLDPSERQRIRGSISFTQLFPDRDRQLYMQAKLSNSGALYAGRDNDLMFESWFIEMVKEISNELD